MEFVQTMSTTNISPTYQIDPEQQLRIKARYNATVRHTGTGHFFHLHVMSSLSHKRSQGKRLVIHCHWSVLTLHSGYAASSVGT